MLPGNHPKSSSNRRWTVNPSYKRGKRTKVYDDDLTSMGTISSIWFFFWLYQLLFEMDLLPTIALPAPRAPAAPPAALLLLLLVDQQQEEPESSRRSRRRSGKRNRKKKRRSSRRGAGAWAGRAKQHKRAKYLFEKHCKPKWPGCWVLNIAGWSWSNS